VEEGTGKLAKPYGYTAAGKTGTAQKFVDGAYSHSRYVASFVGFAPVDSPAIVTLVMIDEPKGTIYGSSVAAPAFKEIVERSLVQLGVPQKKETLHFARTRPGMHSAEDSDPVDIQQVVESALREEPALRAIRRNKTVVVPLESNRLPDFAGKSMREVARLCSQLGVKLKVRGAGRAVAQRPLPGAAVYNDTVCEVFFNLNPIPVRTSLELKRTVAGN
jgi:membrane peptidoglycan carboxypeptidase